MCQMSSRCTQPAFGPDPWPMLSEAKLGGDALPQGDRSSWGIQDYSMTVEESSNPG